MKLHHGQNVLIIAFLAVTSVTPMTTNFTQTFLFRELPCQKIY